MSLIKCTECGKMISDKATSCPQCGYPLNQNVSEPIMNNKVPKKKSKRCVIIVLIILLIAIISTGVVSYLRNNTCMFGHIWKDATCTESKTCSKCGETDGEPLGHTWEEATCTSAKTCTVCGEVEGEPLGHTTRQGYCENCGNYIDELQDTYDSLQSSINDAWAMIDDSMSTMAKTSSYYDTTYVSEANQIDYKLQKLLDDTANEAEKYEEFIEIGNNLRFASAQLYLFDDLTSDTGFGAYEYETSMATSIGNSSGYLGTAQKLLNEMAE